MPLPTGEPPRGDRLLWAGHLPGSEGPGNFNSQEKMCIFCSGPSSGWPRRCFTWRRTCSTRLRRPGTSSFRWEIPFLSGWLFQAPVVKENANLLIFLSDIYANLGDHQKTVELLKVASEVRHVPRWSSTCPRENRRISTCWRHSDWPTWRLERRTKPFRLSETPWPTSPTTHG